MRARWLYAAATALVVAPLSLTVNAAANSLTSPEAMLAAAAQASKTTNFEGVLVYRSGSAMEVMRVVHRYRNREESERLLTLTGQTRELIRQGDHLTCILPRDHRLVLQRPSMKSFLTRLDGPAIAQLSQWYVFKDLGTDRIAGRDCIGVAVQPRDAYRYGYEIWLDSDRHLPLQVVLRGADRRVLEQVMFTEISFPAKIPDQAFASQVMPSPDYKILTQRLHGDAATATVQSTAAERWHFGKLPPGFRMTLHDQRDMSDGVGHVDHMLVSDGLSSVSVFAAQIHPANPGLQGQSHIGAVHAYGRNLDGYHITVVGEAPARTVQMIGNAIALPATASPEDAQAQPQLTAPVAAAPSAAAVSIR